MKSCHNCRHLYNAGGEYTCYACELFGEDIPYELEKDDACCLHPNEVKKAINLKEDALYFVGDSKRQVEEVCQKFNEYMKHLLEKYGENAKDGT